MRVAIAVSEYHRGGGFQRLGAQIASGLNELGHEVTVFSRRVVFSDEDRGLVHRPYKIPEGSILLSLITEPFVVSRLMRKAAKEFDVAICVGMACLAPVMLVGTGTHRAFYEATINPASGGSALRRLFERVRPFHWIVMLWERAMLNGRHPRVVAVPDETRAQQYVSGFDFPRERIALLPPGVELEEFRFSEERRQAARNTLGVSEDTKLLLHIGNRGRQKGLDVLFAALERLDDGEWLAILAGSGSEAPSTRVGARRLIERGRVRLLGRVSSTLDLYCAADLLVFPSRFDPWGLVVTEALASGLPVIASAGMGAAIAVRPGENGWLLEDPSDAGALSETISKALSQLHTFNRERTAATVVPFSHLKIAERFEEKLKQMVEGTG